MEEETNPLAPLTSFPHTLDDHVMVMLVSSSEKGHKLDETVKDIKTELKLDVLSEGVNWSSRPHIAMSAKELPRMYEVVNALLKKGHTVQMNDGTQIVFEPCMAGQASLVLQQQLQLQLLQRIYKEMRPPEGLPYHQSAYWCIEDGKKFAVQCAAFYNL